MILDFFYIIFSTFLIVTSFFIFAVIMKILILGLIAQYHSVMEMKVKLIINEFAQSHLWVVDAARRILKTNLDQSSRKNLMLIISIDKNLKLDGYGAVKGYIIHEDTKYDNVFTIHLDAKLSSKQMLSTLCHELSHLIQYAEGRHKTYTFNNTKYELWNGINYGPKDSIEYSRRPWEIEAKAMESKFVEDYYQSNNDQ